MTMTKYSEIEIETAKNLLEHGYKWIAREKNCKIWAYKNKPHRDKDQLYCAWNYNGDYFQICTKHVPILLNVTCADKEPVSLESIVHPQILDDAEKRYLKGVIRPFRNDVTKISKRGFRPYVFLKFNLKFNGEKYFFLNNCYTVTMFKGMEPNRWYTPKELGL